MNKKKTLLNLIKNNYTWLLSAFIVSMFIITFMIIFKVTPFGSNSFVTSDGYEQVLPLLAHLQHVLKNGESFSYNWNSNLGGNFLPSYFYYIASPFNLLVCFINKSDIQAFMSILIALRMIVSAGTFGFFLSRRNGRVENSVVYVALSCGYALSNYMCGYYYQTMWFDTFAVFPLVLLGYIRLKENKPILYILSLSYSLYCNYYLSYIVCLSLVLFFLFDKYKSLKDFFIKGVRFAMYSVLAAGMSSVSLICSYIGITKTVSAEENVVSHKWYGNIFEVVRQILAFNKPIVTSFDENESNLYCGVAVVLFFFLYLLNSEIDIISKIKKTVMLLFLIISMNESLLNYVWHGFHEQRRVPNRFAFVFIAFILIISAESFDKLYGIKIKYAAIAFVLSIMLPLLCYIFVDFDSIFTSHQVLYISMVLILLYSVLVYLFISIKSNKKKIFKLLFSGLFVLEIIANATLGIKVNLVNPIYENIVFQFVDEVNDKFLPEDHELFYRYDFSNQEHNNIGMYCNMNAVGVFNSTTNAKPIIFEQYMGNHTGTNRVLYTNSKNYLDDILGVKYIYDIDGTHNYDYDKNYELLSNYNGINIYKNINALSLGYGVKKSVLDYRYVDQDITSKNVNSFVNSISSVDSILNQIYPKYSIESQDCEVGIGDTEYLSLQYEDYDTSTHKTIDVSFNAPYDGVYYVDIRSDNGDLITFNINDNLYKQSIWFNNGLNGLGQLSAGDKVTIEISDNLEHAYQESVPVSELKILVYKLEMNSVQEMVDYLSKNQMVLDSFTGNSLSGNVTLESDQILFTSIPYDEGWHVYENGKEVKKVKVSDAFLGVDLNEGTHKLTFVFIPEGLYLGLFVTILCWVLFIVICIMLHRRRNSSSITDSSEDDSPKDK